MISKAIVPIPPLPPICLSRLLLVEGDTPMHFFEALLRHFGKDRQIEIRNFRSVAQLKPTLIDLVQTAEFQTIVTSLGIVRDAETDAIAARQSVDGALQAAGLTAGRVPPIKTSVFILPDNISPGMIETLCMQAVDGEPALTSASACTTEFFACLGKNAVALPVEPKLAKNRAQAYLATRMEVQLFPGQAAYKDHWPWNNPLSIPSGSFYKRCRSRAELGTKQRNYAPRLRGCRSSSANASRRGCSSNSKSRQRMRMAIPWLCASKVICVSGAMESSRIVVKP